MFTEDYYKLYNNAVIADYALQREKISALASTKPARNEDNLTRFVRDLAKWLDRAIRFEARSDDEYYRTASLTELAADQLALSRTAEEDYDKSYLNPVTMSRQFGGKLGPVLCAFAYLMHRNLTYAKRHMRFAMSWNHAMFLEAQTLLKGRVRIEDLLGLIRRHEMAHLRDREGLRLHDRYSFDPSHGEEMVMNGDFSDPGLLYYLNERVSEEDIRLAGFMNTLPQEEVDRMARALVEGFRRGFFVDGKDIMRRKTVGIYHRLGMERMTRRAMEMFRTDVHYIPYLIACAGTPWGQQCEYDHRFDMALWMDEEFVDASLEALGQELEENAQMLRLYGGPAVIHSFGEPVFNPVQHREAVSFREDQQELYSRYQSGIHTLMDQYIPPMEYSFSIVAYPVPQIGPAFEEIFHETVRINTLDNDKYLKAQQYLIDALDQGVQVEITGREGNDTDLVVKLPSITNPAKQTNFYNCVADVNIPVGEVFTSPSLAGTNGVLHVESFFADGMLYKDLKLVFADGYIQSYSCANYDRDDENERFIHQNLLFPHETLPMGEFAIGTNTWAYRLALKYGIMEKLPILIIEKMGPHFAIGDTCYVGTEDLAVYNPMNGKEIVARENEKTALRKSAPAEAYTHAHTDITLPYSQIGCIRVRRASGMTVDLIRNGRFVLAGTQMLNEGLELLEQEMSSVSGVTLEGSDKE